MLFDICGGLLIKLHDMWPWWAATYVSQQVPLARTSNACVYALEPCSWPLAGFSDTGDLVCAERLRPKPDTVADVMRCPELLAGFSDPGFSDPEVMAAVADIAVDSRNLGKYKDNPKVRADMQCLENFKQAAQRTAQSPPECPSDHSSAALCAL